MKIAKMSTIVLGITLFVFMISSAASAQTPITDAWFKGKVNIKGFEINGEDIVGKAGGGGPIYLHIVADVNQYNVITCAEDFDVDDTWHTLPNTISTDNIYGSVASGEIWDFFEGMGLQFFVGGVDNIYFWPMFQVKYTNRSVSFKSFACGFYNDTEVPWQLGSCSMSFKTVDVEKVPLGCQDQ